MHFISAISLNVRFSSKLLDMYTFVLLCSSVGSSCKQTYTCKYLDHFSVKVSATDRSMIISIGLLISLVHEVYKKHTSPGNFGYPNKTLDGFRAQQLPPEIFYALGQLVVASEIV